MVGQNGTKTDHLLDVMPSLADVKFSTAQHRAARLIAEDDLPNDTEIAKAAGVARSTLSRWKLDPDFKALIGDYVGALNAGMLKLAIAKKRKRIEAYDELWQRSLNVIRLRAERHAAEADTPEEAAKRIFQGGATPPEAITGMMVREETITAGGSTIIKWSYDKGLVSEIRALEEQAAKELGQWQDQVNLSGSVQMVRIIGALVDDI